MVVCQFLGLVGVIQPSKSWLGMLPCPESSMVSARVISNKVVVIVFIVVFFEVFDKFIPWSGHLKIQWEEQGHEEDEL